MEEITRKQSRILLNCGGQGHALKILVVDDEPDLELVIRQRFRKEIRENQYQFTFAYNGIQALEKLKRNGGFDLVLSGINMPQMDGLTLWQN